MSGHDDHAASREARLFPAVARLTARSRQVDLMATLLPQLPSRSTSPRQNLAAMFRAPSAVRLNRIRRRRDLIAQAKAPSGDWFHRLRALRQRHGEIPLRRLRRAPSTISDFIPETPSNSWRGSQTPRSMRWTCRSTPIHGRSAGIGNGGSCKSARLRCWRAFVARRHLSLCHRHSDYAAWTLGA